MALQPALQHGLSVAPPMADGFAVLAVRQPFGTIDDFRKPVLDFCT